MQKNKSHALKVILLCLILLVSQVGQSAVVKAAELDKPLAEVSPWELIAAMNALRNANGLPSLIEDPIINAVAQSTAQIMADTLATWHIGNVAGRISAAGYGGGSRLLATENFAVGSDSISLDVIMFNYWNDPDHMLPAVTPGYCHVGAGSARASNGMTYYILQAAGVAGQACSSTSYPTNPSNPSVPVNPSVPQIIVPVEKVQPDANGNYMHTVKSGQSFWAIAVAYGVTGDQIRVWNNLHQDYLLQPGDVLTILGPNAQAYTTPTPSNQIVLATPGPDGRVVHVVKIYQNLEIIAKAYGVGVESILTLNNWSVDWPLQLDQKLLIKGLNHTPTPTQRPLTPIEMLTPAADGRYYHVVREGQNIGWISGYYGVTATDLMAWNGLNATSIIFPGEKLLLQVTPPATLTPTSLPSTPTPLPSPTPTPTDQPTTVQAVVVDPTPTVPQQAETDSSSRSNWLLFSLPVLALLIAGGFVAFNEKRKRDRQP